MGITLAEYRDIMGGRATLAEIEAKHKAAAKVTPQVTSVARPCDPPQQVAQIVHPAAPANLDGGWFGDLPYPPSLNRYYRHVGSKVLISKHGRRYRKQVERLLAGCTKIGGKVMLRVDVYPPDLRRRDLDNLLKGLQDALVHGGLLADDSDIKRLWMEMHEPKRPDGMVRVGISRISGK